MPPSDNRYKIRVRGFLIVGGLLASAIVYKGMIEPYLEKRNYVQMENEMRKLFKERQQRNNSSLN